MTRIDPVSTFSMVLAAASCFAGVATAGAAPATSNPVTARALFKQARQLMEEGRYGEACPKLEESRRRDDGIGTRFNLAYCWEKQKRLASAWSLYLDVAAEARNLHQPEREAIARRRAQDLEVRLAQVQLNVPHPVPGLEVVRDGAVLSRPAWGTSVPVDPGAVVVEVRAPGHAPWKRTLRAEGGRALLVDVPALRRLDGRGAGGSPAPSLGRRSTPPSEAGLGLEDVARGPSHRKLETGGLIVAGLGVVGLATAGYFSLQYRDSNASAKALCRGEDDRGQQVVCDQPEQVEQHDGYTTDARNHLIRGWVAAGTGGALLATGAVLYFWDELSGEGVSTEVAEGPTSNRADGGTTGGRQTLRVGVMPRWQSGGALLQLSGRF